MLRYLRKGIDMPKISVFAAIVLAIGSSAVAQTAPSPGEIAAFSPLFSAAHDGDAEEVKTALESGGDIDERDNRNRLATHVAGFSSNEEALAVLAEAGADMNALDYQLYDVVTIAAVANDPDMVRTAIKLGNRPDLITSVYDGTALIAAAHLGHHEVVAILIEAGAPLDHINNLGWTALIEAVVLGDGGSAHVRTAQHLVKAGADQSIADRNGVAPLEHAKMRGFDQMVEVLETGQSR